jgi:hypothetical protein
MCRARTTAFVPTFPSAPLGGAAINEENSNAVTPKAVNPNKLLFAAFISHLSKISSQEQAATDAALLPQGLLQVLCQSAESRFILILRRGTRLEVVLSRDHHQQAPRCPIVVESFNLISNKVTP